MYLSLKQFNQEILSKKCWFIQ